MGGAFQLYDEDAVDWLARLSPSSIALAVLDPGIPGRAPRRGRDGRAVVPAFPEDRWPELLYEVHRLLTREGLCWWVTEAGFTFRAAHVATRLGFAVGAPVVWDRGDGAGNRMAFVLPLSCRRPRSPGAELVVAARSEGAGLPLALATALIEWGSAPGEIVVDPFMGSGALGLAALTTGRRYLGSDIMGAPADLPARLAKLAPPGDPDVGSEAEDVAVPLAMFASTPRPALGRQAGAQLSIFGDGTELR